MRQSPRLWPVMLLMAFLIGYAPLFLRLIEGPWRTEEEGHGPLIVGASIWLIWHSRARLDAISIRPSPVAGWATLSSGLLLMILARTQGVLVADALSALITLTGCILLLAGVPLLLAVAFPLGFLLFAVPVPDWMIDAATVPLKVFISDTVTRVLYAAGYPIAHDGVIIVIGPYQVLVKDACSGLNSIFALSAIGAFYVYVFRRASIVRSIALLAAIVPIAIAANFLRVLILVLIAYHGGIDKLAGPIHALTGVGLFVAAVVMLVGCDAAWGAGAAVLSYGRRVER